MLFTVEAAPDRHPPSAFCVWRHESGVGAPHAEGVAWRVGSSMLIVEPIERVYGFPPA
jgi:hypothetical protein